MADFVIDDQSGATFLVELNDTLDQIAKNSLGSTAPSPTFPGMFWVDTSGANPVLRIRDGTNTTWANMGTITTSTGFLLPNTTAFTRNFLNDPDASTARTTLGLGALATADMVAETSFTAVCTPSTSGTVTLAQNTLYYERHGTWVHVWGRLTVQSVSSPVGNLEIGPLPYSLRGGAVSYNMYVPQFLFLGGAGAIHPCFINFGQTVLSLPSSPAPQASDIFYIDLLYHTDDPV